MQIKHSHLWGRTALIALCAVLLLIWAGSVTESPSIVLLSWVSAPLLGLLVAHMWLTYGMLPPAPEASSHSSPPDKETFALSAVQFFPIRDDYTEDPPQPPEYPRFTGARVLGWVSVVLGWLSCLMPLVCLWASFLAILFACVNPNGIKGAQNNRVMPILRLTLTGLCLGIAGIWRSAMLLML